MSYLLGVQHVNLTIEDEPGAIDKAYKYYVEVLGLENLYRPENVDNGRPGLWLALGKSGQQIHISTEKNAVNYNGSSRRHAAFFVDNLAELQNRLTEAGEPVEGADQFPGQLRCFGRDPFGNRLEFVQQVTSRN